MGSKGEKYTLVMPNKTLYFVVLSGDEDKVTLGLRRVPSDLRSSLVFLSISYSFLAFLSLSEPLVSYMPDLMSVPGLY